MKRFIVFLLFISVSFYAFANDHDDDIMIVRMMDTDAVDLKCDYFPFPRDADDNREFDKNIQEMMNQGRYIISITDTKYGTFVLNKQNTESIKQKYVRGFISKKNFNKEFKNGFSLKFFNNTYRSTYTLFEKNPKITKQVFVSSSSKSYVNNKRFLKMNLKGLFAVAQYYDKIIFQNGHDNITLQYYSIFSDEQSFLFDVEEKQNNGYTVKFANKHYNNYSHSTFYRIIYEKPKDGDIKHQSIALIRDAVSFANLLQEKVSQGYNLDMIWGGWDKRDYEAEAARSAELAASNTNNWEVLGGLATSVAGLIAGPSNSNNVTSNTISSYNTNIQTNSSTGNSNSANSSKLSESFYRDTYARWTKVAESAYKSLTVTGVRVKDKNTGKDVNGSAAGTWGSRFNGMKMELRKAQREMKKTREEALRAGYKISQSEYETINVSY